MNENFGFIFLCVILGLVNAIFWPSPRNVFASGFAFGVAISLLLASIIM